MRVQDQGSSGKGPNAFEISAGLGRRRTAKVVSLIPGVRVLRWPRFVKRARDEVFCEFELNHERFNVWEPFGDNSRYWIGPSDGKRTPTLLLVRQTFINYQYVRFPWLRKWARSIKGMS
jgi:hypothetical protein